MVIDVWDDESSFATFGEIDGPASAEVGLEANPQVFPPQSYMGADGVRTRQRGGVGSVNPLEAVNRWNDAWNTGDTDAVAATYAEDVAYQHAMLPEPVTGREAVRAFISGMGGAFSDIDDAVTHAVVTGTRSAEVRHRARHTGELPTPMGPVPATDKIVELVAAHFFRINSNGLIVEERMYANPMALLAQLGVMPGPYLIPRPSPGAGEAFDAIARFGLYRVSSIRRSVRQVITDICGVLARPRQQWITPQPMMCRDSGRFLRLAEGSSGSAWPS